MSNHIVVAVILLICLNQYYARRVGERSRSHALTLNQLKALKVDPQDFADGPVYPYCCADDVTGALDSDLLIEMESLISRMMNGGSGFSSAALQLLDNYDPEIKKCIAICTLMDVELVFFDVVERFFLSQQDSNAVLDNTLSPIVAGTVSLNGYIQLEGHREALIAYHIQLWDTKIAVQYAGFDPLSVLIRHAYSMTKALSTQFYLDNMDLLGDAAALAIAKELIVPVVHQVALISAVNATNLQKMKDQKMK